MNTRLRIWAILGGILAAAACSGEPAPTVPFNKYVQTLVASTESGDQNYLMVPVCLRLDDHTLLVGYKRGASHFGEREAAFELMRIDPVTERIDPVKTDLRRPGVVFQDGELVRFANGDVACYIDAQAGSTNAVRLGLLEFRSRDGGRTFQDMGKVGLVDGVEYGYAFEAARRGPTTWMLAMRFTNLRGGGPAVYSHHAAGSVDVIASSDNGKTWHFVRNLTREFGGYPINESSLAPAGDGYIVATRGYDNRERLQLTGPDFRLIRQVDLDAASRFVNSYIGRPRVFERDGGYYLMGRNWVKKGGKVSAMGHGQSATRNPDRAPMVLSLIRFDPVSLAVTKHVILDNAGEENVIDGYYAVPYWQKRGGRDYFDVVTYKRAFSRLPDIIRLEFFWDEVR